MWLPPDVRKMMEADAVTARLMAIMVDAVMPRQPRAKTPATSSPVAPGVKAQRRKANRAARDARKRQRGTR